jgi:hypothetical protein
MLTANILLSLSPHILPSMETRHIADTTLERVYLHNTNLLQNQMLAMRVSLPLVSAVFTSTPSQGKVDSEEFDQAQHKSSRIVVKACDASSVQNGLF